MLCAFPFRARLISSPMVTSSTQWPRFSMSHWVRITPFKRFASVLVVPGSELMSDRHSRLSYAPICRVVSPMTTVVKPGHRSQARNPSSASAVQTLQLSMCPCAPSTRLW